MVVRIGSSDGRDGSEELEELPGVKWRGTASAMVRSRDVSGVISLIMHRTVPGCPSNPVSKSESASYTSVVASAAS